MQNLEIVAFPEDKRTEIIPVPNDVEFVFLNQRTKLLALRMENKDTIVQYIPMLSPKVVRSFLVSVVTLTIVFTGFLITRNEAYATLLNWVVPLMFLLILINYITSPKLRKVIVPPVYMNVMRNSLQSKGYTVRDLATLEVRETEEGIKKVTAKNRLFLMSSEQADKVRKFFNTTSIPEVESKVDYEDMTTEEFTQLQEELIKR